MLEGGTSRTMAEPLLQSIRVENYGCIRDLHVRVPTALHAFIGPNDSGKSTLLRAVRTAVQFAGEGFYLPGTTSTGAWEPFDPSVPGGVQTRLGFEIRCYRYEIAIPPAGGQAEERLFAGEAQVVRSHRAVWGTRSSVRSAGDPRARTFTEMLAGGARMVKFSARSLREPSPLVLAGQEARALAEDGFGLAGLYDVLVNRGDDVFARIAEDVRERFPAVRRLQLRNVPGSRKQLQVELSDGTRVAADRLSDGLLYYLAFAALPELMEGGVLLVEEPEAGLHPARIVDVVRALRRAAERCSVLVVTHSPLVVDELKPKEISVVMRPNVETGTKVRPLTEVPHLESWMKAYGPGDLWVALADGRLDDELFEFRGDRHAAP